MSRWCAAVGLLASGCGASTTHPYTVCQVVGSRAGLDKRHIEIQAEFRSDGRHGGALQDPRCPGVAIAVIAGEDARGMDAFDTSLGRGPLDKPAGAPRSLWTVRGVFASDSAFGTAGELRVTELVDFRPAPSGPR